MDQIELRVLDTPEGLKQVEAVHAQIWGSKDVVPYHILWAMVHNGGLAVGAFDRGEMIGFVFGFLGVHQEGEEAYLKHCSHQLAVLPEYRNANIGFMLKKAQWQLVQQQGIEIITWTYDPLLSTNSYLNIAKLGAICNTYHRDYYGDMVDDLNAGIPSDRFEVQWWLKSRRVGARMTDNPRPRLDLAHYLAGETPIINSTRLNPAGFVVPEQDRMDTLEDPGTRPSLVLFEIPTDFQGMRDTDLELAQEWRMYSRIIFELFFGHGYLATDFIYTGGNPARSYFLFSHGKAVVGAIR